MPIHLLPCPTSSGALLPLAACDIIQPNHVKHVFIDEPHSNLVLSRHRHLHAIIALLKDVVPAAHCLLQIAAWPAAVHTTSLAQMPSAVQLEGLDSIQARHVHQQLGRDHQPRSPDHSSMGHKGHRGRGRREESREEEKAEEDKGIMTLIPSKHRLNTHPILTAAASGRGMNH